MNTLNFDTVDFIEEIDEKDLELVNGGFGLLPCAIVAGIGAGYAWAYLCHEVF